MSIFKFDPKWAATGSIESPVPDDNKITEGWVGGEQVEIGRLNWLQDRLEDKINLLIEESVNSFYNDAADPQSMISTGLWDEPWGSGVDSLNVIDAGTTSRGYKSMCVYFTALNEPQLLVLNIFGANNITVEVWDPRTMTLTDTSGALADDLPSGSSENWIPESMCTDGTSIYCVFTDTNPAPDEYRYQAWDIATWAVKSGWAATGTAGPSTGTTGVGGQKYAKIIMASSTKLAVMNRCQALTASSSAGISIVDITDGTIDASGAGDATTSANNYASAGMCSDGTNVYFVAINTSTNATQLCTATIADPTAGTGGTGYPLTVSAAQSTSVLVACGPDLIVSVQNGAADTDIVLRTHDSGTADLDSITMGQDSQATPVDGDVFIMGDPTGICFDGINIWIYSHSVIASTTTGVLTKVDVSKLLLRNATTSRQMSSIGNMFFIDPDTAATKQDVPVIFDGRDVWVATESASGATNSGKIHRLPLALLRHQGVPCQNPMT